MARHATARPSVWGHLGELAVVAIPDQEIAARDPPNREFADQMNSVIETLRRYEQPGEGL